MSILIVDDSKLYGSIVKSVLLENKVSDDRILDAADGEEALAAKLSPFL